MWSKESFVWSKESFNSHKFFAEFQTNLWKENVIKIIILKQLAVDYSVSVLALFPVND